MGCVGPAPAGGYSAAVVPGRTVRNGSRNAAAAVHTPAEPSADSGTRLPPRPLAAAEFCHVTPPHDLHLLSAEPPWPLFAVLGIRSYAPTSSACAWAQRTPRNGHQALTTSTACWQLLPGGHTWRACCLALGSWRIPSSWQSCCNISQPCKSSVFTRPDIELPVVSEARRCQSPPAAPCLRSLPPPFLPFPSSKRH